VASSGCGAAPSSSGRVAGVWILRLLVLALMATQAAAYEHATAYSGPRLGMVFQLGVAGLGYYDDAPPTATSRSGGGPVPLPLCLDELVVGGSGGHSSDGAHSSGVRPPPQERARSGAHPTPARAAPTAPTLEAPPLGGGGLQRAR
jgi:hypothetical protein